MKAEDLMVGDWVLSKSINKPCKIIGIDPMEGLGQREGYTFKLKSADNAMLFVHAVSVKPIPLTPKILEKNGFQFYNGIWYVDSDRLDLGILAIGIDDGCGVGFCIMPDGEVSYFCNSVHQMQHFLRLCGIEKTIEI